MLDYSFYISYRELNQQSPVLARMKIIELYRKTQNKSFIARTMKTDVSVVRKIIRRFEKEGEEALKDLSIRPKRSPLPTPIFIEGIILAERKKQATVEIE